MPEDWATTQLRRGDALRNSDTGDREENLRGAFACFEDALRDWTEADSPPDWARARESVGITHWECYLGEIGDSLEHLHAAVDCYHDGLRVRAEATGTRDWAFIQHMLGMACESLAHETYGALGYNSRDSAWYRSAQEAYAAAERGYSSLGMSKEAARMRSLRTGSDGRSLFGRLTGWLARKRAV